jgi:hypothetical protein
VEIEIDHVIKLFAKNPKHLDEMTNFFLTSKFEEETLKRLKEAYFFLSEMNKSYMKSEDFHYYLSAFVLHARTITWVMKKEYGRVPGWELWYQSDAKIGVKGQADFFKKIAKMRNKAEKEGEIGEKFLFSFTISKDDIQKFMSNKNLRPEDFSQWCRDHEGKTFEISPVKDGAEATGFHGKISELRIEHDYFPDRNILDICATYLFLLTGLVLECVKNFGGPPSFEGLLTNPESYD